MIDLRKSSYRYSFVMLGWKMVGEGRVEGEVESKWKSNVKRKSKWGM